MREGINAILEGKSVGKGNANTINKTVARSFVGAIVVGKLARSAQPGSARRCSLRRLRRTREAPNPTATQAVRPPSDVPTRFFVYTIRNFIPSPSIVAALRTLSSSFSAHPIRACYRGMSARSTIHKCTC